MIDVYAWGTTNGLRATLAMAECGLTHRVIPVATPRGEQKRPEYLAINPAGQIPAMVDHDAPGGPLTLAQSGAIVLYACHKAGRHIPAELATQASAMQWFMQAASDIAGASSALAAMSSAEDKPPAPIHTFEQRLLRFFTLADRRLADRDFLAGAYSMADIMLYPNYALRRGVLDRLGELPHLRAWGERITARPATAEGMQLMQGT